MVFAARSGTGAMLSPGIGNWQSLAITPAYVGIGWPLEGRRGPGETGAQGGNLHGPGVSSPRQGDVGAPAALGLRYGDGGRDEQRDLHGDPGQEKDVAHHPLPAVEQDREDQVHGQEAHRRARDVEQG